MQKACIVFASHYFPGRWVGWPLLVANAGFFSPLGCRLIPGVISLPFPKSQLRLGAYYFAIMRAAGTAYWHRSLPFPFPTHPPYPVRPAIDCSSSLPRALRPHVHEIWLFPCLVRIHGLWLACPLNCGYWRRGWVWRAVALGLLTLLPQDVA